MSKFRFQVWQPVGFVEVEDENASDAEEKVFEHGLNADDEGIDFDPYSDGQEMELRLQGNESNLCWDDIEWLRAYVEHIQSSHPDLDADATQAADKKTGRPEALNEEARAIYDKLLRHEWFVQTLLENEKLGQLTDAEEEALEAWRMRPDD